MSLDKDHSYELMEELGGGGFATAYKTRIINRKIIEKWKCEEIVVIKLPNDEESSIDLSHEIELNNAIKNSCTNSEMDYLCKVYGVGAFTSNFGPRVVMVMEYMPEGNLRRRIEQNILTYEMTLGYIKDILRGLCIIHQNKIVHRDIKPENILFKNDRPKIADLGIGKALHSREFAMTVIGTIYYMSPELLMGIEGATYNTDLWSLGIMMHEMLFGCLPFEMQYNHAQGQIINAIVNIQDLHSPVRKDLPEEIISILKKSLEKDRTKRYQTAREMLTDIEKLESERIKEGPEYKAFLEKKVAKNYDAAALILEELIEKYPKTPELYIELEHVFQLQSDMNRALDILNRGIAENPDFGNLYFEAAILFNQMNERDKTLEYLQNSIRLGISDRKNMIVAQTLIKNITTRK